MEVMERTLRGQCPEGPCNNERDSFEAKVTPAAVRSATLWYDAAELLLGSRGGDSSRGGAEGGVTRVPQMAQVTRQGETLSVIFFEKIS